jgi:hypothetical protein
MEHVMGINCSDVIDIGINAWANFGHGLVKGYNGKLFKVSLAGWSVACLNSEFNG